VNRIGHEKAVSQWVEEAALLWLRREHLIGEPHLSLPDFLARDHRMQRRLDALVAAGPSGWQTCAHELKWEEPGEVFPATYVALTLDDAATRLPCVLDYALRSEELARPMISAFAWKSLDGILDPLEDLLTARDARLRRIGLAAALAHRQVPESALSGAMGHPDAALRARALRGVGEMGCLELLPGVVEQLTREPHSCRLGAAWTCALRARHPAAIAHLLQISRQPGRVAESAVRVAIRAMPVSDALEHIEHLAADAATCRVAAIAAGALGSPEMIEWLIPQLDQPPIARVAGEAWCMITGLTLEGTIYQAQRPEAAHVPDLNDAVEDAVEMELDEHLAWPNARTLADWWARHRHEFPRERRFLLGRPVEEGWCRQVLRRGRQRQRAGAALELALTHPTEPLFEVRAPAARQESGLSGWISGQLG
jgi:uncharacterized protein (TIGR02270 family)